MLLEDFVFSDTTFKWKTFGRPSTEQALFPGDFVSSIIPLIDVGDFVPSKYYFLWYTSSIKSSLLYTRKENALLFRASQTCSKNYLATLSHVIHCHFHFLVLPQSEIYYFSRQYFNTSAAMIHHHDQQGHMLDKNRFELEACIRKSPLKGNISFCNVHS